MKKILRFLSASALSLLFVYSVYGAANYIGNELHQTSTDSTTGFQWLDSDGGNPIMNIDSTNERVGIGSAAPTSLLHVNQTASTSGSPTAFTVTGGAHTNLAATVQDTDIFFDLNRTKTWLTGAITSQADYAFDGASTITQSATMLIPSAPLAGSNATLTNTTALAVGDPSGAATAAKTASLIAITLPIQAGFSTMTSLAAIAAPSTGIVNLGNQTATLTNLSSIGLEQITYDSTTLTRTVTNPATLLIEGAPVNGGNVTFTNGPYSLWVQAGNSRFDGKVGIGSASPDTTLELEGTLSYTPSTTQILVAGTALTVVNAIMRIDSGAAGAITMTATPTVADGADGECVIIQGDDNTNTVKFQDEAQLANTGLQLSGGTDFTFGVGDILEICYDSGDDNWYEITRSNN